MKNFVIIVCFLSLAWLQCKPLYAQSTKEKEQVKEAKDWNKELINKVLEAKKKPTNPFENIRFSKAVLYQFKRNESMFKDNSKELIPMEDEKVLSSSQAQEIIEIMGDTSTYGQGVAACFIPRHGVIFYDLKNKPIAHITICMACNRMKSSPFINVSLYHHQIRTINGEKVVIPAEGFSKLGRQKLVAFFKKCGLKYDYQKSPMFDK